MKKKLSAVICTAVLAVLGFLFAETGLIEAAVTKHSDGYPVALSEAGDTVSVISVGQANSTLISSGGKYCLIDMGETFSGHISVVDYLKYAGVKELELVVITHFHSDHTSQLLEVMDSVKINNIVIPNLSVENVPTADYFKTFLRKAEIRNINLKPAVKGIEYTIGNGKLTVVADTYNDLSINDTSVATLFTQGDFSFLATGDGEAEYEARLLKDFNQKVTLLAAGHHGSSTSSTEEFIKAVSPDFVAVSAGRDNEYGHPHREVRQRFEAMGIPYAVTAEQGTIVYSITENKPLEKQHFKGGRNVLQRYTD